MNRGQNLAVDDVGEHDGRSGSPYIHWENYQAAVIGMVGARLMVDEFPFRLQLLQVSKAPRASFALKIVIGLWRYSLQVLAPLLRRSIDQSASNMLVTSIATCAALRRPPVWDELTY